MALLVLLISIGYVSVLHLAWAFFALRSQKLHYPDNSGRFICSCVFLSNFIFCPICIGVAILNKSLWK